MRLTDYFFYLTYAFLIKMGRDEDAAKWSALMHTSVYFSMFLNIVVYALELLYKDDYLKYNDWINESSLLVGGVLSMIFLYFRFYKLSYFDKIQHVYIELSVQSKKNVKLSVFLIMLFIPIILFVIARFYLFGYVL